MHSVQLIGILAGDCKQFLDILQQQVSGGFPPTAPVSLKWDSLEATVTARSTFNNGIRMCLLEMTLVNDS